MPASLPLPIRAPLCTLARSSMQCRASRFRCRLTASLRTCALRAEDPDRAVNGSDSEAPRAYSLRSRTFLDDFQFLVIPLVQNDHYTSVIPTGRVARMRTIANQKRDSRRAFAGSVFLVIFEGIPQRFARTLPSEHIINRVHVSHSLTPPCAPAFCAGHERGQMAGPFCARHPQMQSLQAGSVVPPGPPSETLDSVWPPRLR